MKIDQAAIEALAQIMQDQGLGEIEYQDGDQRIKLVSETPKNDVLTDSRSLNGPELTQLVRAQTANVDGTTINAPTVGIFYTAKSPQDPPYVQVGDHVEPGQIVGVIEAMKMFTNVMADQAGTVERVLVNNEEGVEYGQPLIQIK